MTQAHTTVVTAFYPLKSKHSTEKYMAWMRLFCQIPCSLVVYTDEATAPVFESLRAGLPTTIVVKPFDSYEMTSPAMMALWTKHHGMDREKAIHNPSLYAIWALKQECVANTIATNPYGTDWFVWCDVGIQRDPSKQRYYRDFPGQVPSLCKPGHIGFLEVENIPDSFVTTPRQPAPFVQLGGGCIVGDKVAWAAFCPAYKAMLQTMDARGEFVGKDQTVFFRMLVERTMPFRLFRPRREVPVDPWMQMPAILAGTVPATTDERFSPKVSYVKLAGGLGNQLFEIAAAYAHARRNGYTLKISHNTDNGHGRPTYFHSFLHSCKPYIGAPAAPLYREPHFHYAPIPAAAQSLSGYFQCSRYFADVSGEVRALFDPSTAIKDAVAANYAALLTEEVKANSVIIHIRRGDYLRDTTHSYHGILSSVYYKNAMARFRTILGDHIKFYILSDDIKYCAAAFPEATCIDESDDCLTLHLMSQFRHYIISNSTFSWWATWLGEPSVHVIAPDRWFGPKGPQDYQDVYEPEWIRIKAE